MRDEVSYTVIRDALKISERPTGLNWCKFRGSFSFAEGLHIFTKEKIDKYFSDQVHDFATIATPTSPRAYQAVRPEEEDEMTGLHA